MAEIKVTAANFEREVMNSDKPILVDFYADWCGPCQMLSPILQELAEENADTFKVGKVNVDEQMELAVRFKVSSIPTMVLFKDKKAVAAAVGFRSKAEISAMIEGAI
jgi:thioredoxin 1